MRGQPQQNGAKNQNLTVHCLATLNKKGRLQPREGKDMKCYRKKGTQKSRERKKERKRESKKAVTAGIVSEPYKENTG